MTRTRIESKKLRTRIKEVDKLREKKPVNIDPILAFFYMKILPMIAERHRTIPAK